MRTNKLAAYRIGEYVYVKSMYLGDRKAKILDKYKKNGIDFYEVDIEDLGPTEVTQDRIRGTESKVRAMKSFTAKVEEELSKKRLNEYTTDEYTSETNKQPKAEVMTGEAENTQVPGGAPGPLSPEEMNQNPKDLIAKDIIDEMGADSKFALEPEQAKKIWEAATQGSVHKFNTCMEHFRGKVNDEKAFCGYLSKQAGYKPQEQ